jgi:hypothetical protein
MERKKQTNLTSIVELVSLLYTNGQWNNDNKDTGLQIKYKNEGTQIPKLAGDEEEDSRLLFLVDVRNHSHADLLFKSWKAKLAS